MLVKLNAFRGDDRPGDVVDVSDADGATLIAHGAAFPADDIDAELTKAEKSAKPRRRTVRGEAALQASSVTQGDEPTEP